MCSLQRGSKTRRRRTRDSLAERGEISSSFSAGGGGGVVSKDGDRYHHFTSVFILSSSKGHSYRYSRLGDLRALLCGGTNDFFKLSTYVLLKMTRQVND